MRSKWPAGARRWGPLLIAFAALGSAASASAEASADTMELVWEAPKGCPDERALRSALQRWLEQSPDPLDTRRLYVEARVEPEPAGFALDLLLESQSGSSHQRLHAQRCETLVDVVGLKVTLAAALPGGAPAAPVSRPRAQRSAAARSGRGEAVPSSEPAVDVRAAGGLEDDGTPARLAVALLGGAELLGTPGVRASIALELALDLARWRLLAGVQYAPPQSRYYSDPPGTGARLQRLTGHAQACIGVLPGRTILAPCAGIELGTMRGAGVGVAHSSTSDQVWGAGLLGASLRLPLSSALSFGLDASALLVFARPSFHVQGLRDVYRAPGWGVRLLTGLELGL